MIDFETLANAMGELDEDTVKEELEKTPYGKYYETIQDADCWLRDNNAQDVWIKSDDGLKLHGLWVPAENAVGTVLLVHGYRSTKLVDLV